MSHPEFPKASQFITADAIRDTLVDLVNIPSPTGREAGVAHYLCDRMKRAGLDTDLQYVGEERPNAVGLLRGSGKGINLLFTGHMDTSYSGEEEHLSGPGYKPKATLQDGWVWGLGASNMKSGLAGALVAIEAIVKAGIKLPGDISFGGVVGEIEKAPVEEFQGVEYSGYGTGSKHMVTHGVTADYALLVEPTRLRISTANMGAIWLRITVGGTIAHSALTNRPGTVNAIAVMHDLQNDIMKWAADYEKRHSFMNEHANVTIACIRGGAPWRLSRNPRECSLYLDIRTVPGQKIRRCEEGASRRIGGLCRTHRYAGTTDFCLCHRPADDHRRDAAGRRSARRRANAGDGRAAGVDHAATRARILCISTFTAFPASCSGPVGEFIPMPAAAPCMRWASMC